MRCAGTYDEVAESRLSFTAGFVAFIAAEYCLIIVSSHRFDPYLIDRTTLFHHFMSFSSTVVWPCKCAYVVRSYGCGPLLVRSDERLELDSSDSLSEC